MSYIYLNGLFQDFYSVQFSTVGEMLHYESVSSALLKDIQREQKVANPETWSQFIQLKVSLSSLVSITVYQYSVTQWWDNKRNQYSGAALLFNREVLVLLSGCFWLIVFQWRYSVSESDASRQGRDMNMMNPTLI